MDRLTFDGNFCDIAMCRETKCPYDGACTKRQVWERLKAYEETGLEPEEAVYAKLALMGKVIAEVKEFDGIPIDHLRELAQAEKDGRLVVLHGEHTDKDGQEALRRAMYICGTTNNAVTRYTADAIAEKLSREEAEAALKGGNDT